ncbi:MAG TPA: YceI family protein [Bryobacteraceae bacterium]|nr:YceI family protein [Bryobacteraceae bacterium]
MTRYCSPAAVAALLSPGMLVAASDEIVDVNRSVLIVHVGKTGLFSAAGHEHWVDAPISRGQFNEGAEAQVEFAVDAQKMMVRPDEKTSTKDRAMIQETMQSSVLESQKYPEIRFRSTSVTPMGRQAWRVAGTLTLHGVSKAVAVEVRRDGDVYAGSARLKQTEFGIQPVSIAGGVVKVKNELDITFKITGLAK